MRMVNRLSGFVVFILGICIINGATKLSYMMGGIPGPGFFPLCVGISISIVAVIIMIFSFSKNSDSRSFTITNEDFKKFFIVIGGSIVSILATMIIGLVASIGLMTGVMAYLMGEKRKNVIIALTIISPIILHLIFAVGLNVPLPMGIFK